jgi:hypothetical protein
MSDATPNADVSAKPRFRRLRIAWSLFFALLTVALCMLWVRSYWRMDILAGRYADIASIHGQMSIGGMPSLMSLVAVTDWKLEPGYTPVPGYPPHSILGFYYDHPPSEPANLMVPDWFLVLISGTCAVVPWRKRRWAFSLRTMLLATTLIAAVLGLIAWLR